MWLEDGREMGDGFDLCWGRWNPSPTTAPVNTFHDQLSPDTLVNLEEHADIPGLATNSLNRTQAPPLPSCPTGPVLSICLGKCFSGVRHQPWASSSSESEALSKDGELKQLRSPPPIPFQNYPTFGWVQDSGSSRVKCQAVKDRINLEQMGLWKRVPQPGLQAGCCHLKSGVERLAGTVGFSLVQLDVQEDPP